MSTEKGNSMEPELTHNIVTGDPNFGMWATVAAFITTWVFAGVGWAFSYGLMTGRVRAQEKQNASVAASLGRSIDHKTTALQKAIDENKSGMLEMMKALDETHKESILEIKKWFVDGHNNPRLLTVKAHDNDCNSKQLVLANQIGTIAEKIDSTIESRRLETIRLTNMERVITEICATLKNGSNVFNRDIPSMNGNGNRPNGNGNGNGLRLANPNDEDTKI